MPPVGDLSLSETDLTGLSALVLGDEQDGLRRLAREKSARLVSTPLAGLVESLNLAVSAGVLLFEAVRQRGGCPALPRLNG